MGLHSTGSVFPDQKELGSVAGGETRCRSVAFLCTVGVISLVSDGWAGKPSPVVHQLLLLPVLGLFVLALTSLLRSYRGDKDTGSPLEKRVWLAAIGLGECLSMVMFSAEVKHFRSFGYHATGLAVALGCLVLVLLWLGYWKARAAGVLAFAVIGTYVTGLVFAIYEFPLNYLRSDMLPVIGWADQRLVHRLNPYTTMHVGTRLYDFPYLPGVLSAYLPVSWLGVDLRWTNLVCVVGLALMILAVSRDAARWTVAAALGAFLLCPFLQYRHDLYLQPHWFVLAAAVVLMQRRHFVWAAALWGVSCGIYQLSWVLLPFIFLNAFRRGSWAEFGKVVAGAVSGVVVTVGPFFSVAAKQMAHNTVGQWSRMPHALAEPINLSYWLTYLIRPDELRWVQAVVLTALFAGCFALQRCRTLVDTLRWMSIALAVFIPLNVLVDGYFYLTLLLLLLLYLCAANGWWPQGVDREDAVAE